MNSRQGPPEPAEHEEDVVGRPVALPDPEDLEAGIELSDVNVGGILKAGLALLIFIIVSVIIVTGMQWAATGQMGDFRPPQEAVAPEPPPTTIPEGVIRRVQGVQTFVEARDLWMTQLNHYTYLDEEQSRVSIPIDVAMETLLSEGFFQSRPQADSNADGAVNGTVPAADSSGGWMDRTREWLPQSGE